MGAQIFWISAVGFLSSLTASKALGRAPREDPDKFNNSSKTSEEDPLRS